MQKKVCSPALRFALRSLFLVEGVKKVPIAQMRLPGLRQVARSTFGSCCPQCNSQAAPPPPPRSSPDTHIQANK